MSKLTSFEEFMKRCDQLVTARYGVSIHDCVDANWHAAYQDIDPEEPTNDRSLLDIAVDILSDADRDFATMVEIAEAGGGCE